MKTVTIEISGATGTGKTTIVHAIGKALEDIGFKVTAIDEDEPVLEWCKVGPVMPDYSDVTINTTLTGGKLARSENMLELKEVVVEKEVLSKKMQSIICVIHSDAFSKLQMEDKELLLAQAKTLQDLDHILHKRIVRFFAHLGDTL